MTKLATKPPRFCYRAFEFRYSGDPDADGRTLEGYAAVFNNPTRIQGWEGTFDEVIMPGAFKRTLNARTPVLQFNHGLDARTGSVPIGAIRDVYEDDHGLFVRARLFDNDAVKPVRDAIAGGAIDGMSFRFRVNDDRIIDPDDRDDDGAVPLRQVREVEVPELGPVVFPAYDATSVGVRSLLAHLDFEQREQLIAELADTIRGTSSDEPVEEPVVEEPAEEVLSDPAEEGTSEPQEADSTPQRHSALYGEPASWHLPDPQLNTVEV